MLLQAAEAVGLRQESLTFPSWTLRPRQLCDLELLLNGGFAPLTGFLGRADHARVVSDMRLADGALWPIPIVLDVDERFADTVVRGDRIALRDPEGVMLAVLELEEAWTPDRGEEAAGVYGTEDPVHPGVRTLLQDTGPVYLAGRLIGIELPAHHDFIALRRTPREVRDLIHRWGWTRVVAFQTRNPMHRAHVELTFRAMRAADAKLLVQPVVGLTKPGDVDHYTRVRCYQRVMENYPEGSALLSLLPLVRDRVPPGGLGPAGDGPGSARVRCVGHACPSSSFNSRRVTGRGSGSTALRSTANQVGSSRSDFSSNPSWFESNAVGSG